MARLIDLHCDVSEINFDINLSSISSIVHACVFIDIFSRMSGIARIIDNHSSLKRIARNDFRSTPMADFQLPRNHRKNQAGMPKVTESSCNVLSVNLNINCVKMTKISAVIRKYLYCIVRNMLLTPYSISKFIIITFVKSLL